MNLLDDTPVVPGDIRPAFEHGNQARQILNDAEDDLREWTPELEDVGSSAHMIDNSLMPSSVSRSETIQGENDNGRVLASGAESEGAHLAHHNGETSRVTSGASVTTGAYPASESEAGTLERA